MKRILFFSFLTITVFSTFAIEVDKSEIDSIKFKTVEFINYSGLHDKIDSVETIRGIGRSLGSAVQSGKAGDVNRYAVIHCVDPSLKEGLDADIFIIGKNAGVDHIDNLRLMIAGYLSSAYGYSQKDAATIAHFVTIYNAVYRGQMDFFNKRYKAIVTKNLTAEKAGIALKYDQWPGQTQIVIPLSDAKYSGTISAVDTSSISDKKVIEKMRESDDKNIEARKDMVDLKERESEAAEKRADVAKEEADKKEKEADVKQKEADKAKEEADKAKKEADKAKKETDKAKKEADKAKKETDMKQNEADKAKQKAEKTGNKEDKKEAEKKEKEAEKAKEDVKKASEEAEKKQKEADTIKQEAEKKQKEAEKKQKEADTIKQEAEKKQKEAEQEKAFAEEKTEDAQSDRKDIAADTQKIIEEQKAEKKAEGDAVIASAIPGHGLKVTDQNTMLSELVLLDLKTEAELRKSSINTIRGRYIYPTGDNFLAIAGSNSGNAVIALVLIDPKSLEIIKQSEQNIAGESVLVKNDDDYYAVIDNGGKYFLGRFHADLKLQAKSAIEVLPYTPITVGSKGLLVQDSQGIIRILRLTDLTNIVVNE